MAVIAAWLPTVETAEGVALLLAGFVGLLGIGFLLVIALVVLMMLIAVVWPW